MKDAVSLQLKAVHGCMQRLYWLVKREIPHTRNYASLLVLVEELGCDYFKALKIGHNATYISPEVVGEFLDIIAASVKECAVKSVAKCESFALMCDESTDIGSVEAAGSIRPNM